MLPLSPLAHAVATMFIFTAAFYVGTRALILRDEDTLQLTHRLIGSRLKLVTRLLPPAPLLNP
jgi:hypothetical protein